MKSYDVNFILSKGIIWSKNVYLFCREIVSDYLFFWFAINDSAVFFFIKNHKFSVNLKR